LKQVDVKNISRPIKREASLVKEEKEMKRDMGFFCAV
jgi:hypothetical protein